MQIRLKSVSARFRHQVKGDIAAVRDVSLEVEPGELMTLLGPSGCGKTTTLRMIAGFQEPSAGRIFIGERDVTQVEANERNIGFVFQNYALFPHLSVFENVAYGLRIKRMDGGDIARAVSDVLALVGLASYERQMPHQLSGGEQQRVALARAIVIEPRVLLFDEPLSNLDAKLRTQMRGEIRELQRRLGITTVYVTHDQEEAMAISDRIAVMNKGVIEQLGSAEDLYRRPATVFVARFIGRSNLIEATVTGATPGRIVLTIAGEPHAIDGENASVQAGQAVLANVRPEAIAIGAAGGGLAGMVMTRTYLGEKMEYEVDVAGQRVQIVRFNPPPAERFAVGDAVSVRLPHEGVQLLAREGA
jgi:iron(III) transport system ATP-binding protein